MAQAHLSFTAEEIDEILKRASTGGGGADLSDYATKEYVEEEIAKFDFIKIVSELPEVGLPNRIYFVPKSNTSDNDLFDEYAWVNEQWEFYGTKQIEVDLTEYVKRTDYASTEKYGVIKTARKYGLDTLTDGVIYIIGASKSIVDEKINVSMPITPSIIDYAVMKALTDSKNHEWTDDEKELARALLGAIGSEDYATKDVGGVVKISNLDYGVRLNDSGTLEIREPSEWNITNEPRKNSSRSPITISKIDIAVKEVLKNPQVDWTEEEKAKALETLGGVPITNTQGNLVYISQSDGKGGTVQNTIPFMALPIGGTLMYRDSDGCSSVGTPIEDTHATNKKYVDDLIAQLQAQIDALKGTS